MMQFDYTVNIGHIFTIFAVFCSAAAFYFGTKYSINNLNNEMKEVKLDLKALNQVVTTQAVQTSRLDNMSERINRVETNYEEMRRGKGYIVESR